MSIYFAIPDVCDCCDCHEPLAQTWAVAQHHSSLATAQAWEAARQWED